MERAEAERALFYAMSVGEQLLISGAEVSRVEDTIRRIGLAYGAERVDVFSITSSILATLYYGTDQFVSQSRRVTSSLNDFDAIDRLNQLSRTICKTRPRGEWIRAELKRIAARKRYSPAAMLLIYATIAAGFSALFGGDFIDIIASAVIGALLRLAETALLPASFNRMFTQLLYGFCGGVLANFAVMIGAGHHADLIALGDIMLFIPGLAFTNSLRDLFSGDTVTGLIRLCESLLLAILLAFGFALANLLF